MANSIKLSVFVLFTFSFLMLSGCGTPEDRLIQRQIDLMSDYADAVENEAPKSTFEALEKEMAEIGKAAEKLNLTKEEKEALQVKYKDQLEEVGNRFFKAMSKRAFSDLGLPSGSPSIPGVPGFGN